jgi:hypothetical protein
MLLDKMHRLKILISSVITGSNNRLNTPFILFPAYKYQPAVLITCSKMRILITKVDILADAHVKPRSSYKIF